MQINTELSVALFEPRIPQNTGNIARTCAAFKVPLSLIKPLGFSLNDRYLKRAGLDYWQYVDINLFDSFIDFASNIKSNTRIIGCSKSGGESLSSFTFDKGDVLLLGREDTGLPDTVRNKCDKIVSIMMPGSADINGKHGVRSLNLSVATSIVLFEAGKQLNLW